MALYREKKIPLWNSTSAVSRNTFKQCMEVVFAAMQREETRYGRCGEKRAVAVWARSN